MLPGKGSQRFEPSGRRDLANSFRDLHAGTEDVAAGRRGRPYEWSDDKFANVAGDIGAVEEHVEGNMALFC